MMVYKYTLHDPDSGKVLYEGNGGGSGRPGRGGL